MNRFVILVSCLLLIQAIQCDGSKRGSSGDSSMTLVETMMAKLDIYQRFASDQRANARALLTQCVSQGITDRNQLAYVLSTAIGECALRPIKEYKGKVGSHHRQVQSKYWNFSLPDNKNYFGRGFVQLTWDYNYRKFGQKLGLNLLGEPDLALNPTYAAQIACLGMKEGSFTGKKLGDYFSGSNANWTSARRIINGTDKAQAFGDRARAIASA